MSYYRNPWPLGQTAEPEPEEPEIVANKVSEVTSQNWMLPVPVAQQIFAVASGVAGGLAGLILAQKFTGAKAIEVRASEVLLATGLSFAATFGAIFLIRSVRSYEEVPGDPIERQIES